MKLLGPGGLDPAALATAMNAHPANTGQILAHLDPTLVAGVLNSNPNLLPDLLVMLNPTVLTESVKKGDNHLMRNFALKLNARAQVLGIWISSQALMWTNYMTNAVGN